MEVVTPTTWKRSKRSAGANNCVELASAGAVRDSKNPHGPVLVINAERLLAAVKSGHFDR